MKSLILLRVSWILIIIICVVVIFLVTTMIYYDVIKYVVLISKNQFVMKSPIDIKRSSD